MGCQLSVVSCPKLLLLPVFIGAGGRQGGEQSGGAGLREAARVLVRGDERKGQRCSGPGL